MSAAVAGFIIGALVGGPFGFAVAAIAIAAGRGGWDE